MAWQIKIYSASKLRRDKQRELEMKVYWIERNQPPAPIPGIITEDELPSQPKALFFLPHSDDGRYAGATLSYMNDTTRTIPTNKIKIVLMTPGYHGVTEDISKEQKNKKRFEEFMNWGQVLGFDNTQLILFNAEKTYETSAVCEEDQARMNQYIQQESPTMIFLPHISDIAQSINFNTRNIVLNAAQAWMTDEYNKGNFSIKVTIAEYPTNHVPILPPSDKNLVVVFGKRLYIERKRAANKEHKTQRGRNFQVMEQLQEAIDTVLSADDVDRVQKAACRLDCNTLQPLCLDPLRSRCEHFGITRLSVQTEQGNPIIKENRIHLIEPLLRS